MIRLTKIVKNITGPVLLAGALVFIGTGCTTTPAQYSDERPDPNQLSPEDSGLQSKDVEACTSQLVSDLLASPKLNASATQWTLAVDHVQDMTRDRMFDVNYDIFTEDLRSAIGQKGQGRIQLIENLQNFRDLKSREVAGTSDPYGQGGSAPAAATDPDYILYGKAIDMPNRSTNFYLLEFTIFNQHTRQQVWTGSYKVKVAR